MILTYARPLSPMVSHLWLHSSKPLAMYPYNERLFWTSLPTASNGLYVHTEISVYSQVFPVDLPLRYTYIHTYVHSALRLCPAATHMVTRGARSTQSFLPYWV